MRSFITLASLVFSFLINLRWPTNKSIRVVLKLLTVRKIYIRLYSGSTTGLSWPSCYPTAYSWSIFYIVIKKWNLPLYIVNIGEVLDVTPDIHLKWLFGRIISWSIIWKFLLYGVMFCCEFGHGNIIIIFFQMGFRYLTYFNVIF